MEHTRVWELADGQGWSQADLASKMGISETLISRTKRGERPIGRMFIEGARRAFPEYTLDWLFPVVAPEVPA